MNESLILKTRRVFTDGSIEDPMYTPMSALNGEEIMNLSIGDHEILNYMRNYKRATTGEASWWEVYSNQEKIDKEIALEKRAKSAAKLIMKIIVEPNSSNIITAGPKAGCKASCIKAATNKVVDIKFEYDF